MTVESDYAITMATRLGLKISRKFLISEKQ